MDPKHIEYFVIGFMMKYYENMGYNPREYTAFTEDTVLKVKQYISKECKIHGGFHDQQACCAVEASKLFSSLALTRRAHEIRSRSKVQEIGVH